MMIVSGLANEQAAEEGGPNLVMCVTSPPPLLYMIKLWYFGG